MEIRFFLALARRWLWLLVLGCALGAGVGYALSRPGLEAYSATTKLLVQPSSRSTVGPSEENIWVGQALARTY